MAFIKIYDNFTKPVITTVTYHYNGSTFTRSMTAGENAAEPSGFTFNIPDCTFIGWTDEAGTTTAKTSIPASGNAMTLYCIYKYNDKDLSLEYTNEQGQDVHTAQLDNITTDKYARAMISLELAYEPHSSSYNLRCYGCVVGLTQSHRGSQRAMQPITSNGSITLTGKTDSEHTQVGTASVVVYGNTICES